jgi:hypothetical protein
MPSMSPRLCDTDPNGLLTSFSYDDMLQPISIGYPEGGQTTYNYPSPTEVDMTQETSSSLYKTGSTLFDGLGRQIRSAVSNGESVPYDQTDTCYDADGRVSYQSYTYQGTGLSMALNCSEPGNRLFYDALKPMAQRYSSDRLRLTNLTLSSKTKRLTRSSRF